MDSLQTETKQEEQEEQVEHNCIIALTKPTEFTSELADFCLKIKENHLQLGLNINKEA